MLKLFYHLHNAMVEIDLAVQSPACSFALWDQVKRLAKMDPSVHLPLGSIWCVFRLVCL